MNAKDFRERTPAYYATESGDLGVLQDFLTLRADPIAPDLDQIRPIHLAAK